MYRRFISGMMLLVLCVLTSYTVAETPPLLSIANKYIKIYVNNTKYETGRFAVDTTEGDATRTDDDHKPLIYGRPRPWTSFTTIRIDGKNHVFGKATKKRSGKNLPGGEIVRPPQITKNKITMQCRYGDILVEQVLDIIRSPSTGALDTVRIKYICKNEGTTETTVGIRTLFDTMLGNNDGAPFRLGEKEITGEFSAGKDDYPDFWQAFDSLASPAVIAQGTLRGGEVTAPDKIVFANWGKAADNPWDIQVEEGQSFVRKGEEELDSTIMMYWWPKLLKPKEEFSIVAYYGLGGITFAPGNTLLGISAPAEVQYNKADPQKYTIVLYLENRGEAKANDVKVRLDLPMGLEVTQSKPEVFIPELIPGVMKQISWEIRPNGVYQGDTSFQIIVSGDGLESNQVSRNLKIVGPPRLVGAVAMPKLKVVNNYWQPTPPLTATLVLRNIGETAAYDIKAVFQEQRGVKLAPGERAEKLLGDLAGKQQTNLSWQVIPENGFEVGKFNVNITGIGVVPLKIPGRLPLPPLPIRLHFTKQADLKLGQVYTCELKANNLLNISKFDLDIKYNPQQLRLVNVSRGLFGVAGENMEKWSRGLIKRREGIIYGISTVRREAFSGVATTLVRLNFIATGLGSGQIKVDNLKLYQASGEEVKYEFVPTPYTIK